MPLPPRCKNAYLRVARARKVPPHHNVLEAPSRLLQCYSTFDSNRAFNIASTMASSRPSMYSAENIFGHVSIPTEAWRGLRRSTSPKGDTSHPKPRVCALSFAMDRTNLEDGLALPHRIFFRTSYSVPSCSHSRRQRQSQQTADVESAGGYQSEP
eukprot:scaffold207_cov409-Prasinococcus_capsulatus_cf.AAC.60